VYMESLLISLGLIFSALISATFKEFLCIWILFS
jgi:hypothetical protein